MSKDHVDITIHALGALTVPTSTSMASNSRNLQHGDEMILTAEIIEACRDRNRRVAILELLDDPEGQVRAWGSIKIRRGAWPGTAFERILPGSPQWDDARAAALRAAAMLPTQEEQRAAAAAVRTRYGSASSAKSATLTTYGQAR